jgi:hypothetical protein
MMTLGGVGVVALEVMMILWTGEQKDRIDMMRMVLWRLLRMVMGWMDGGR